VGEALHRVGSGMIVWAFYIAVILYVFFRVIL
jgi:hypothetical protein